MKIVTMFGAAALGLVLASTASAQAADSANAATQATPGDTSTANARHRPRRNPRMISQAELDDSHASNLYDVVVRLHPRWVQFRVASPIRVFRNDIVVEGGVDAMRSMSPTDVATVRWLDSVDAKARFGLRAAGGAILITDRH